jgi:hypothetical protein
MLRAYYGNTTILLNLIWLMVGISKGGKNPVFQSSNPEKIDKTG